VNHIQHEYGAAAEEVTKELVDVFESEEQSKNLQLCGFFLLYFLSHFIILASESYI